MKFAALLVFISLFSFAIEVGQDVELTNYVNARYAAKFRATDQNVIGKLAKGTKGTVKEVRPFRSGNSGILIEVLDGSLKSQKVWVYYNAKSPKLALLDKNQSPVATPDDAATATATAPLPAVREPATGPGVVVSDTGRALAAIASINRQGAISDCALCNESAPGVATAAGTRITSSVTPAGDLNAKMTCSYAGEYGALPGTIAVEVVNNRVISLKARVDGCNVTLEEFKQVDVGNKNIVLKNAGGCAVVLNVYNRVRSATPTVHFGMVATADCVSFCSKVERKFWQVEMNPGTQTCY